MISKPWKRYKQHAGTAYTLYRSRKLLWPMLRDVCKGRYRFSLFTTLAIVLGLAYILFPFDLLPDFIPLVGWIDDGALFWLLLRQLKKETARYYLYRESAKALS